MDNNFTNNKRTDEVSGGMWCQQNMGPNKGQQLEYIEVGGKCLVVKKIAELENKHDAEMYINGFNGARQHQNRPHFGQNRGFHTFNNNGGFNNGNNN